MAPEPHQRSHAGGISAVYLAAVAAMLLSIAGWVVCIALTAFGVVDSWVPATRWIWLAVGAAAGLTMTWRAATNDSARTASSGVSLRRRIPMVLVLFPWKGSPMALVGLAFAGLLLTVPVGSTEPERRT